MRSRKHPTRRNRKRSNKSRRRTYKQRGGGLKEDALTVLKDNGVITSVDYDTYRPQIEHYLFESGKFSQQGDTQELGEYTFQRARQGLSRLVGLRAFKTADPSSFVTLAEYD